MLVENGSVNLSADFLTFTHNSNDGLLVENSPNLTLENSAATHNGQAGIQIQSGSNVLDIGFVTAFGNGTYGIYDDGTIPRLHNSSATFNGSDGIHLSDVGGVLVQSSTASNNGGVGIYVNQIGAVQAVVGALDVTQNLGNIVANNSTYGILTYGNVLVAGNTVSGSTSSGYAGIYLDYAGEVANNDVFGNYNGIVLFDTNTPIFGNRVYHNANDGIFADHSSPLYDNVVYSNGVGIQLGYSYGGDINNNLIYANTSAGYSRPGRRRGGNADRQRYDFRAARGRHRFAAALDQRAAPQRHHLGAGRLRYLRCLRQPGRLCQRLQHPLHNGQRSGRPVAADPRPTMQLWRNADFTDADSLFANPLFVNVGGGNPGYASSSSDGRGDDFHEQSQQGSYHGGALAPVVSATTGLPMRRRRRWSPTPANRPPSTAAPPPTAMPTSRSPTAATSTSAPTAIRLRPRSVRCSSCS